MLLGLLDETKTADNLRRHPECVVNLRSPEMWERVESRPIDGKESGAGVQSETISFRAAQVSICGTDAACERSRKTHARETIPSLPGGVRYQDRRIVRGPAAAARLDGIAAEVEVEVIRVQVASDFVIKRSYIDAAKWSPLIYNFRHYFRLAEHEPGKTVCAEA
jgi:hypothetical protein